MRKIQIKIKKKERQLLQNFLKRGEAKVRMLKRCQILLFTEQGLSKKEISALLSVAPDTVQRIRDRYRREGLEWLVQEKIRSGRPRKISDKETAAIVALACSAPPVGRVRWTERLLTVEIKRRKIVPQISKTSVGEILRKHRLKPWRKKNVVRAQA